MIAAIGRPDDLAGDDGGDGLHRLSMTILMTPDMSNFAGNVHGGLLLKYLDQVAYTCATRYARNYAVTLSVDQVVFREPVHVGELVTLQASVNWTGRTSMEFGVRVTTQDPVQRVIRHTNSCYFTMVCVGPDGRPVSVPPWRPRTVEEGRRHDAATRCRELRRVIDRVTERIREFPNSGDLASPWPADLGSAKSPPAERGPPCSWMQPPAQLDARCEPACVPLIATAVVSVGLELRPWAASVASHSGRDSGH